jgi:transcriptional regulator with XRE-family HTH domain
MAGMEARNHFTAVAMSIVIERLEQAMRRKGYNRSEVARRAGLGTSAVYDIISGKNKNPAYDTLRSIAKVLDCELAYLLGETDNYGAEPKIVRGVVMPIIGVAEAGAYRKIIAFEPGKTAGLKSMVGNLSRHHPQADHFLLEIRGDSMNATHEGPLTDGMYAICVDMISADLRVESGNIYAIRRTLDGGLTYETTLRRALVRSDRVELIWESTDPEYHESLTVQGEITTDPRQKIYAFGKVIGSNNNFEK